MVFKKGHLTWNKGKKTGPNPEHSERMKGKVPWNKGIPGPKGKENPNWKGSKASYSAMHRWIRRWKQKSECCEKCGKKGRLELANISGKYKRDINDFEWLCIKCHRNMDKWFKNVMKKVVRGKDGKFYKNP